MMCKAYLVIPIRIYSVDVSISILRNFKHNFALKGIRGKPRAEQHTSVYLYGKSILVSLSKRYDSLGWTVPT